MTISQLHELFEKYIPEEMLDFDRIAESERFSNRPDLHAFILLDKMIPGNKDLISHAKQDEIRLSINLQEMANLATESDILTLVRCGVNVDVQAESLVFCV